MNAQSPRRGGHLVEADRHFETGNGWLGRIQARLQAGGIHRVLDRIDEGVDAGRLEAFLPDGSFRVLGNRGPGPVAEVHIKSWKALARLASAGSVGWYKAWELGEWTSPDMVPLFDLFLRNRAGLGNTARAKGLPRLFNRLGHWLRRNSRTGSRRNIEAHYDLGNDFYAVWLDSSLTYSSALFASPHDMQEPLEIAQTRKIDAMLDRLNLKPGDSLLEIGCGWGSLAQRAVEQHDVLYTGLTLSAQQADHARARIAHLPDAKAQFTLTDYRDVTGPFDAIASCEMVEAVGEAYWPAYLDAIARNLKSGGRAAIQYIAIADDIFPAYRSGADFIQTYVFPGGMLLSESRFRALAEARGLDWQDQHMFGAHYAETLRRWRESFDAAVAQGLLPAGFDARFVRLWRFYLMYCEGGFRSGGIDVGQVTLVKR